MMNLETNLDPYDKLFVFWAFLLQIILIAHFAIRKPYFESYTMIYGWLIYALAIPALAISILLMINGKDWTIWIGGFIFVLYAAYGFLVDYLFEVPFRAPFQATIGIPYIILYLATVMFYWWPMWSMSRLLWSGYAILYIIATILNIRSH